MNPRIIDYMTSRGRAPSFNARGEVRGFRSRPGAPQSERDTMIDLGVKREPWQEQIGGASTKQNWDTFFAPPQASFNRRKNSLTESGAPALDVPFDTPEAPVQVPQFNDVNDDGMQLPGDSFMPPGMSRSTPPQPMRTTQTAPLAGGSQRIKDDIERRFGAKKPGTVSFSRRPQTYAQAGGLPY